MNSMNHRAAIALSVWLRLLCMAFISTLLVACGGGGGGSDGSGTPPFGGPGSGGGTGGGTTAVTGLVVTLSSPTIVNSGTSTVTVTVTALDSNNNAVAAAPVTLAANANAIVTIQGTIGSVTNASGRLTATVGIGSDTSNRAITLTASSGSVTGTATLNVVNSPTGTVPATIDVIAGSTSVGTGGGGVTISAFVKDSKNNALSGTSVVFQSTTGTLSGVSTVTDASGLATATLSAGADRSNRSATVTVSSGAVSKAIVLPITGTKLTLSGPTSLILGNSAAFNVIATDSTNNSIPGVSITGTSSLGNTLTASGGNITNSTGTVTYNYSAATAGTDNLSFSGAGATVSPQVPLTVSNLNFAFVSPVASTKIPVNTDQTVKVQLIVGGAPQSGTTVTFASTGGSLSSSSAITDSTGVALVSVRSASAGPLTVQASINSGSTSTTLPLVVVGTVPDKLTLQINPTALAPNLSGSTTNQAQVLAKVVDSVGNPVPGVTVNFTRVSDPSGGNLQQASSITDASGKATVNYISGTESTASNGVVLQASVSSDPSVSGQAKLTVNQAALFIVLGTGNTISNLDPQIYKKDWVAYVTDANGIAVNAVTLTNKAIPTWYRTGQLGWNGTYWAYTFPIWECPNEDVNLDGILDSGEDKNGDGVLTPGNVVVVSPSIGQTANGLATLSLTYAEQYANWIVLRLTSAAVVAGTESKTSAEFFITGLATDFSDEKVTPPGAISPFGSLPTKAALDSGACRLLP